MVSWLSRELFFLSDIQPYDADPPESEIIHKDLKWNNVGPFNLL